MIVGFTNGCFDILHKGHEYFLAECARQCDHLVVAINSDESIAKLKGSDRPVESLPRRLTKLDDCVAGLTTSYAIIPFDGYEEGLIVHIRPNVLFRGYDHEITPWRGTAQVAHGIGCAIVQVGHLPGYSTTGILKGCST